MFKKRGLKIFKRAAHHIQALLHSCIHTFLLVFPYIHSNIKRAVPDSQHKKEIKAWPPPFFRCTKAVVAAGVAAGGAGEAARPE